jgi:hypothetical protein
LFLSRAFAAPREAEQKSFLVLFFKKELLFPTYFAPLAPCAPGCAPRAECNQWLSILP